MKAEETNVGSRCLSLSQITHISGFIFNAILKSILRLEGPESAAHVSLRINEFSRDSESHPASSYGPFVESAEEKGLLALRTH